MIARIRMYESRLPIEVIEQLEQIGVEIKAATSEDYGHYDLREWHTEKYNGKTSSEKAVLAYEEAFAINSHKFKIPNGDTIVAELSAFAKIYHGQFSVINEIVTSVSEGGSLVTMLKQVTDQVKTITETANLFNEKCQVHIGGNTLMTINDTLLLEDCCTDELQSYLSKGWRMIAVCVQPDGRRPDYVMGRYTPDCNREKARREA